MVPLLARAAIVAALLTTWFAPITRLAVLPQDRAQTLAVQAICRVEPATAQQADGARAGFSVAPAGARPVPPAQLADMAELFKPAQARQWRTELMHLLLVFAAVAALLARWRAGAVLAMAATLVYLWFHGVQWDAYRLLMVTESPRLWWNGISHWSPALWSERLAAPLMVWLSLIVPAWWLLRARLAAATGRLPSNGTRLTFHPEGST